MNKTYPEFPDSDRSAWLVADLLLRQVPDEAEEEEEEEDDTEDDDDEDEADEDEESDGYSE